MKKDNKIFAHNVLKILGYEPVVETKDLQSSLCQLRFLLCSEIFSLLPIKNILLYLLNDTTNRAAVKILFLKFLSIHSTSTEILTIVQIFNLIKINPTKHFSS